MIDSEDGCCSDNVVVGGVETQCEIKMITIRILYKSAYFLEMVYHRLLFLPMHAKYLQAMMRD